MEINRRGNDKVDETFWREIWQLLLSLVAVIERRKLSHYIKFTTKEARDTVKRLRPQDVHRQNDP